MICDTCIIKIVCAKACDDFEYPSLVSEITQLVALRMISLRNNLWYVSDDGYKVKVTSEKVKIYKNESLHREDGPAVVFSNGNQWWYKNGKRHRDNGPAIIYASGAQMWYEDGKIQGIQHDM
jgi:hypothetical protein